MGNWGKVAEFEMATIELTVTQDIVCEYSPLRDLVDAFCCEGVLNKLLSIAKLAQAHS